MMVEHPDPAEFERLATLRVEDFEALQGQPFAATEFPGGSRLVLHRVRRLPANQAAPEEDARTPFSLLFLSESEQRFAQGSWRLEHPALGSFPAFLVPVGPEDGVEAYEAVFS